MGFFKKVWSGIKDVAKGVSYVAAANVNSITGNEYNPKYDTKFGRFIGKSLESSVDNLHTFFKSAGDAFTGGYASKLANKFRDKEDYESPGNYLENTKDYGYDLLNKLNDFSGLLGRAIGGGGSKSSGGTPPPDEPNQLAQYSGLVKVLAVVVAAWLLIKIFFK